MRIQIRCRNCAIPSVHTRCVHEKEHSSAGEKQSDVQYQHHLKTRSARNQQDVTSDVAAHCIHSKSSKERQQWKRANTCNDTYWLRTVAGTIAIHHRPTRESGPPIFSVDRRSMKDIDRCGTNDRAMPKQRGRICDVRTENQITDKEHSCQ